MFMSGGSVCSVCASERLGGAQSRASECLGRQTHYVSHVLLKQLSSRVHGFGNSITDLGFPVFPCIPCHSCHYRGKTHASLCTKPCRYDELWVQYKKAVASFWTVEEVDLSADMADWERLSGGADCREQEHKAFSYWGGRTCERRQAKPCTVPCCSPRTNQAGHSVLNRAHVAYIPMAGYMADSPLQLHTCLLGLSLGQWVPFFSEWCLKSYTACTMPSTLCNVFRVLSLVQKRHAAIDPRKLRTPFDPVKLLMMCLK
eukprot:1158127-Pelagomonas_calceolata.AAC.4